jgi:hypothetical protein
LLHSKLVKAMEEIKRQVFSVSKVNITEGEFYFKDMGDIQKVVFLFATNLKKDNKVPILQRENLVICP